MLHRQQRLAEALLNCWSPCKSATGWKVEAGPHLVVDILVCVEETEETAPLLTPQNWDLPGLTFLMH